MPEPPSSEDLERMDKKKLRKKYPSGWMHLGRTETSIFVIDALLGESPAREFTAQELADEAGLSSRSVKDHIVDLVELGVVTELPERENTRYQLNQYSPIVRRLRELNTTVSRVKQGSLPKSVSPPSENRNKPRGNTIDLTEDPQPQDGFRRGNHAY